MDEPQLRNSSTESSDASEGSRDKFANGPRPEEITRTLNLRQAQEEFGLTVYAVYQAVRRGQIRAIQPGGRGRIYYLEDELRALAERRAITSCPDNLAA